ncbi:Protection of telomeres protein [Melia azedarach]|uniref:Protection of telomeres protein n=1 Tax=Melia azedarach TaxID=155640 RepID=A0ACC1XQ05_MELAZ|nr:Protection of telomeres protein [Melia azedarach]
MERDDYRFLKIRDAILSINQKVNIIGVIVEIGTPKQTKGSDSFCALKIIDESHAKDGISVNIFADSMEKLPRIASVGDIILLSHVVMKTHDMQPYALFNKKFCSFALYEGKDGKDFLAYQKSSRFSPREQDKRFIAGLRKWLHSFQLNEDSKNFLLLREIKEGKHINLACKILHICEVAKSEWMAFVWDGTDTAPVQIDKKLEDEMEHELPLQLEPEPLSRDILCSLPVVGSILRVIIEKRIEKHIIHLLNPGKWVKLLNVLCQVKAGLWCGVLSHFTKLRYMPNDDSLAMERQRSYEGRLSLKLGRMSYWCFPWPSRITEVDYDDNVPFVTLMDVLTHAQVTAKFKCAVRVVAALPWRAEDFCSPQGQYRIRLTLEDPTARIHAFVYGKDGEKLFDGHPSVDVLKRKINKLLGVAVSDDGKEIKDAPRNPAWVQCCLKSYYLDKNDIWGSRHYRIFDTKIAG